MPRLLTEAQIVQILVLANEALVHQGEVVTAGNGDPAVLTLALGLMSEHRPALDRARALAQRLGTTDSPWSTALLAEIADDDEDLGQLAGCRLDERYVDKQVKMLANIRGVFRDVLSTNDRDSELAAEVAAEATLIDGELGAAMNLHASLELTEATCGHGGSGGAGGGSSGGSTGATGGTAGTAGGGASGGADASTDGGACSADPATTCAGSTLGTWCIDYLFPAFVFRVDPSATQIVKVWSDGPTHTWAVTEEFPTNGQLLSDGSESRGAIFYWDGCTWSRSVIPVVLGLRGIWGANADDVWAVGRHGTALHWNGSTWSSVAVGTVTDLRSISGTSGADVWVGGTPGVFHWDGSNWAESGAGLAVGDIWAAAPDNVWATTGGADVRHFDGATWTTTQAAEATNFGLFAIWADASSVWAVGEGFQIAHLTEGDAAWQHVQRPSGSAQGLLDVMAVGTDVYAVGLQLLHSTGNGPFLSDPEWPGTANGFSGVWMTSSQVWVVGDNFVMHRAR